MASPYYSRGPVTLWHGDALAALREMPSGSVDCIVTSPPYYFMRDYGVEGQIGLEESPEGFLSSLLATFSEARRVLADDGTLWLNLGDSYSQRTAIRGSSHQEGLHGDRGARPAWRDLRRVGLARLSSQNVIDGAPVPEKSMMMLPERLAIAMTRAGWILRSRITWEKTSTLPDPARDRVPNRSEPVLFFSKSPRYFWDADALAALLPRMGDVWRLPPSAGAGSHKASFNAALPLRCISAGCRPGGTVLDPFSGSGTTGEAALSIGRSYVGVDLSEEYLDLSIRERFATV